jgi:hypothetical protein
MSSLRRLIVARAESESYVRCKCTYGEQHFKIKIACDTTVGALMYKLRRFIKINEHEALFIYINGKYYANSMLLTQIGQQLDVVIKNEEAFGALSKQFVRASILQKKTLWVCECVFSWYGVYHYSEVSVHDTKELARDHLIELRCGGYLFYDQV